MQRGNEVLTPRHEGAPTPAPHPRPRSGSREAAPAAGRGLEDLCRGFAQAAVR